ncbi:MAG: sigma 54-interacting transcriptional regulator, partial [Sandaracinaceae bacterium]
GAGVPGAGVREAEAPGTGMSVGDAVFDAQQTLAKVAMARGDIEHAEARLLKLSGTHGPVPPQVRCQALNNLAILAMGRGDLGRASSLLEQAVELAEAHASVFHQGVALKNTAAAAQLDGRWEDALAAAGRALQLLAGIADVSLRARLAFNTADLHRCLGDVYRAGRLCALARGGAQGDTRLSTAVDAEGLRVEAAIAEELGQWPEALHRWEAALRADAGSEPEAQLGRVRVLHAMGRLDEAHAVFSRLETPAMPRNRARHLRCAALLGGVPEARLALHGAEATEDPLLVQEARLTLAERLADAGLAKRSAAELNTWRRVDAALATRVPKSLRPLFEERRAVRTAMALRAQLEECPVRASAPDGTNRPERAGAEAGDRMVGDSPAMKQLRHVLGRVGPADGTVLITGESGSGKELAAAALHAASGRTGGVFLKLNCAALVDALLMSELFGHERGAFTGADSRKPGHFERADGGTLLLDEIGDISPRMQAALLRVLQEGTFERVGGTQTQRVNVRVIAATHRDLAEEVRAGRFREDLYYRLSAITVRVPSLRERRADIGPLARHLVKTMAPHCGKKTIAPDAIAWLERQPWPGNVRQLDNVLRRVAVLSPAPLLTAHDFEALGTERDSQPPSDPTPTASLAELAYERVREGDGSIYELRKRLERELIERALNDAGGNISRAAEWLGMKRPRLSKLVNEWGLK